MIDVTRSTVLRRYSFPPEVAPPSTYLNDLTVDHRRRIAYLVDAGGTEPHGIIRLDLDSGTSKRLLHDHRTVRAAVSPMPGGITVDGQVLSRGQPMRIGRRRAKLPQRSAACRIVGSSEPQIQRESKLLRPGIRSAN